MIVVVFAFGVCFFALAKTTAQAQNCVIVIDPGHGGIDGGVVGTETGVKESNINLSVARILQNQLEEIGFRVVLTRTSEAGLYGTTASGYKKRDMKKRAEIIHETAPAVVVSIHQNFFSLRSRRGAQVFYRNGSDESFRLACGLQASLNGMPECVKQTNPLAGDYYMLNCSPYPSVIVECGFLSNADDEALLVTRAYQIKIASAVANGIVGYLSTDS